jgi:type III secretory pathway component EscV
MEIIDSTPSTTLKRLQASVLVEVNLPHQFEGESLIEGALFESLLFDYINQICIDLSLPIVVDLKIQKNLDETTKLPITISIDGHRCRQQFWPRNSVNTTASLLTEASAIIFSSRQMLLTKSVLKCLAEIYPIQSVRHAFEFVGKGCSLGHSTKILKSLDITVNNEIKAYQLDLALSSCFPQSLKIEVGAGLDKFIKNKLDSFKERMGLMRDGLFYELGIKFPAIRIVLDTGLDDFDFRIHLNQLRGPISRGLRENEFLISDTPDYLRDSLSVESHPAYNPANGLAAAIVDSLDKANICVNQGGLTSWDTAEYLILCIAKNLQENITTYFTSLQAERIFAKLKEAFPLTIVDLIERFPFMYVVDVLRSLLGERFSIRDLRSVMEAMFEVNSEYVAEFHDSSIVVPPEARISFFPISKYDKLGAINCAEYVRRAMKRYLTRKYSPHDVVYALKTTAATIVRLRKTLAKGSTTQVELVLAILHELERVETNVVIVVPFDIRRNLWEAIQFELPYVPVLSDLELDTTVATIQYVGEIRWE